MKEKNPLKLFFVVGIVALMFALGSNMFGTKQDSNSDNTPSQTDNTQIEVVVDVTGTDNTLVSYSVRVPDNSSALDALVELQSSDPTFTFVYQQYDFGAFVTAINGYFPDTNTEFWKFTINGAESSVGITDYKVKTGDRLQFFVDKINF